MNPCFVETWVAQTLDVARSRIEVKWMTEHERAGVRRVRWATGLVDGVPWVYFTRDHWITDGWVRIKEEFITDWKGRGE